MRITIKEAREFALDRLVELHDRLAAVPARAGLDGATAAAVRAEVARLVDEAHTAVLVRFSERTRA